MIPERHSPNDRIGGDVSPDGYGNVVVGKTDGEAGCRISPALDENVQRRSDEPFGKSPPLFRADRPESLRTPPFHFLGNLFRHRRRGRSRATGVGKDVEICDRALFNQMQRVGKGALRFAGEARHHIDSDGDAGDSLVHPPQEVTKEGRGIVPAHRGQDPVIAALEGDMKVAADRVGGTQQGNEGAADLSRFHRTQTEAIYGPSLNDLLNEARKVCLGPKIAAPGAEVDSGEDNLTVAVQDKNRDSLLDLFAGKTPAFSPDMGDDAVAAEGVAAVLDFQKRPGMFGEDSGSQTGDSPFLADFTDLRLRIDGSHFPEDIGNPIFFSVSDNEAYAGNPGDLFRRPLGITARDEYGRRRIPPGGPADELPRLVIRPARDAAGVDDIAIRRFVERDPGHAMQNELLGNPGRFALVHLAAQRGDRDPDRL